MTTCPDEMELEAFVDGQDPANHAKILCHIQNCASCREKVEGLRALNDLIRQVEQQHVAPRTLVDRLRQESVARGTKRPAVTRRVLFGAAAAACSSSAILALSSATVKVKVQSYSLA